MASGIYNIGVTALAAAQTSLATTAHNVANAQTEGYSRQRVDLTTQIPMFLGGSFIGSGVKLDSISRAYDGFLTNQVRVYNSSHSRAEVMATQAGQVDQLLSDVNIGMMPVMQSFFGSLQDVANDPSSITPRQTLLNQSGMLVDRFHALNQRFEELRTQVNGALSDNIAEINSYSAEIADLNKQIVLFGKGNPPNDILDRRDALLAKLSEKISVNTVTQTDGSINVFIGNGQTLVLGFDASNLLVERNNFDINVNEIAVSNAGSASVQISNLISGGTLGGLLDFRRTVLDPAQNDLGRLAIGIAETFNTQHKLGQDLNGNLGTDFFKVPSLQVMPGSGVPGVVAANLTNAGQLTGDEYTLTFNGGNSYTLVRNSDQQTTAINTGGVSPYTTPAVDGFSLTLTAGAAVGDQFLIRPTRGGALGLLDNITDPRAVAAAVPIRTAAATTNTGNGIITQGKVTSVANLPLPANVTLQYNGLTNDFTVVGAVPPVGNIPYVPGATIAFNGLEFSITGTLSGGSVGPPVIPQDQFIISNNTGGVGDNRNALLLAGLQTQRVLANGGESYSDAYGGLVADVGLRANSAQISEKAQADLLRQTTQAQQAASGVNLDEEAANLMKFQQLYQAAAQVVTVANSMFQTLLNAVSRG